MNLQIFNCLFISYLFYLNICCNYKWSIIFDIINRPYISRNKYLYFWETKTKLIKWQIIHFTLYNRFFYFKSHFKILRRISPQTIQKYDLTTLKDKKSLHKFNETFFRFIIYNFMSIYSIALFMLKSGFFILKLTYVWYSKKKIYSHIKFYYEF